jgi:glutamate synthase (NADPH) small chain
MREFLTIERLEPAKRLVLQRLKDFSEIYEPMGASDATPKVIAVSSAVIRFV